jgi:hypothetical protein
MVCTADRTGFRPIFTGYDFMTDSAIPLIHSFFSFLFGFRLCQEYHSLLFCQSAIQPVIFFSDGPLYRNPDIAKSRPVRQEYADDLFFLSSAHQPQV